MEQEMVQTIVNGVCLKQEASKETYPCYIQLMKEIEPNTEPITMTWELWYMKQQKNPETGKIMEMFANGKFNHRKKWNSDAHQLKQLLRQESSF